LKEQSKHKIAILSHVLPPAASGQAIVLYRLLRKLPDSQYILISRENYHDSGCANAATEKLSGRYFCLKPAFQLPKLSRFRISWLTGLFNLPWAIYSRAKHLKEIVLNEKGNLLVACTGDLYDLPAAYLASKWAKIPLVPYIFDDYAYQWTGVSHFIAKYLEPKIMKFALNIIVPNEFLQNEYRNRYGVDSIVIRNPSVTHKLNNLDNKKPHFNRAEIHIVYAGAVYHAQYDSFHNLIAAIDLLGRNDVNLHIFSAQLEPELKIHGISGKSVVYHRHIPNAEIITMLRKADILFLPLAFNSPMPEVIKTSSPGKTGEYLSAGKPILLHAPRDSFISWFFKRHDCGVVINKDDPVVLAKGLQELISNNNLCERVASNARVVAEKEFSINIAQEKFINLLNHLIAQ